MSKTGDQVAFSPGEFAALFGKSQTWGYRQIYAGKVKAITEYGRILIPAAEVERILATAGIYDGLKPKPVKSKAEIQKLTPKLENAWAAFLAKRRTGDQNAKTSPTKSNPQAKAGSRRDALSRLTRANPAAAAQARQGKLSR